MTEPRDNGATDHGSHNDPGERPVRDAEQLAEEWAARIAGWMVRGAVRAKEEAEDIWADAQAIRRNL
jgi:hypothetical protein